MTIRRAAVIILFFLTGICALLHVAFQDRSIGERWTKSENGAPRHREGEPGQMQRKDKLGAIFLMTSFLAAILAAVTSI